MGFTDLKDAISKEGKKTVASIFIQDYPAPDWFPNPSRHVRLGLFGLIVSLFAIPVLAAEPALAIEIGGVQDLVDDIRSAIILLGQGILAAVIAYYLVVVGVSNMSSRALKGIGIAAGAIIALEIFDSLILDEVTDIDAEEADDDPFED